MLWLLVYDESGKGRDRRGRGMGGCGDCTLGACGEASFCVGLAASCGMLARGLPHDMQQSSQCLLAGWRVDAWSSTFWAKCAGSFLNVLAMCVLRFLACRDAWRRAREATIHRVVWVDDFVLKADAQASALSGNSRRMRRMP